MVPVAGEMAASPRLAAATEVDPDVNQPSGGEAAPMRVPEQDMNRALKDPALTAPAFPGKPTPTGARSTSVSAMELLYIMIQHKNRVVVRCASSNLLSCFSGRGQCDWAAVKSAQT